MSNTSHNKLLCLEKIEKFCEVNSVQKKMLEEYVDLLLEHNKNFNLIGNSTIDIVWERHILDCAQILKFIKNKNLCFADFGSGAGLPGLVLSILGIKEIHLIEKSFRKCEFLREAKKITSNKVFVLNYKLEELPTKNFDCIVSRALAPLPKLLDYSLKFLKSDGFCLFLKGKNLQLEIEESTKNFQFEYELFPSLTSLESNVILLKKILKK